MSEDRHAAVWVNHSEAKIIRFGDAEHSEIDVHSPTALQRLHHRRTGWEAGGNPPDDAEFFKRIVGNLEHIEGTVITGPGNAKSALKVLLDHERPHSAARVFAVEALDHPDGEALLALGRRYFGNGADAPAGRGSPGVGGISGDAS